jgi:Mlc titration factor MtfA (ptsG expression regulator)
MGIDVVLVIGAGAALVAGSVLLLRGPLARWLSTRLGRARARPLPAGWADRVATVMPAFSRLTVTERDKLLRDMRDLLSTRTWEGAGGLALTDEIRLTIAAQACLLTLGFEGDPYPSLHTILVYPSTFVPASPFSWTARGRTGREEPTLGESWTDGVIVLAWDEAAAGGAGPDDGENVVLHEFAHQLDRGDGEMDGVPRIAAADYRAWAAVIKREYRSLERAAREGRPDVLDEYGATDPAEFFAVATETFFERPGELEQERPELYDALRRYYRQDPGRRAR